VLRCDERVGPELHGARAAVGTLEREHPAHPDFDVGDGNPRAQFHLLFPSLKINVEPGPANLSIGPVWPVAPDRCRGFLDYFFAPEASEERIADFVAFDDRVGIEGGTGFGSRDEWTATATSDALRTDTAPDVGGDIHARRLTPARRTAAHDVAALAVPPSRTGPPSMPPFAGARANGRAAPRTYRSSPREMTSRWMSDVPSSISSSFASRIHFSTGYSRE